MYKLEFSRILELPVEIRLKVSDQMGSSTGEENCYLILTAKRT
jgi:hypothetical protein